MTKKLPKIKLKLEDELGIELWKPSENQRKVLEIAVNDESDNITTWFKKAGVLREKWNAWIKNEKFIEWWNHEWGKAMRAQVTRLDKIGMDMAPTDFRYWEVMQKKYGGYQVDKGGGGTNIIFNIPRPPEREVIDSESI